MRLFAALLLVALPALAGERRFALVVGDPRGGEGTRPLRYAERDAKRIYGILTRLGGVQPADATLLTGASAEDVRGALSRLQQRIVEAHQSGDETVLVVYYSGHAKDGELRLGDSRLPLDELRESLKSNPADVRIAFVDSCQSGVITRTKGARLAPAFDVTKADSTRPHGLVLIASSSADEESQESDEIDASYFTHYLASGLLGDADSSGDGKVTLAEAYAYAYSRTVGGSTGAQHPVYLYDLGGAGDVVLTELAPARGALVFGAATEGQYVVLDGSRRAVAEVAKPRGEERRIALAKGTYVVKKREADRLLVGDVQIGDALVPLDDSRLKPRDLADDPQKGWSGPRYAVLGSFGGQRFFDEAARNGLFPPAALAGVELSARNDLGHQLAWGLDVSVGGGSANVTLPDLTIPERFMEVSGGATLWRDLDFTDQLTLSVGPRVAFMYLSRNFPGHGELPSQSFFTLTPGLQAALSWHFTDRFSAVARGRLNYLFYNVDHNESLGYGELAVGVDYAFGAR